MSETAFVSSAWAQLSQSLSLSCSRVSADNWGEGCHSSPQTSDCLSLIQNFQPPQDLTPLDSQQFILCFDESLRYNLCKIKFTSSNCNSVTSDKCVAMCSPAQWWQTSPQESPSALCGEPPAWPPAGLASVFCGLSSRMSQTRSRCW